MSILSKLFSRKTNKQQPRPVVQIGTEIERPTQINNPITDYLKKVPDWIGQRSGWGYGKEDALIMDTDNSMDGIHNEYVFAEYRSKIEVHKVLKMYYAGFERCGQRLVTDGPNQHYDVVSFKVYLFAEEDWVFLKKDYESHNGYKDDEAGLERHTQLRNDRIKYYTSECWINIDSFFGKR
ncbi:MAG: hypothetical protein IKM99_05980 [Bacteroidales bacterium]|nr:hypothetical protein [Bacteroidales bacterium]